MIHRRPADPAINLIERSQLEEEVSTAYQEYLAMHTVKQSDGEQDEDAEQNRQSRGSELGLCGVGRLVWSP